MSRTRIAALAGSVALAATVGGVEAAPSAEPLVGCEQIVLRAPTGNADGFRALLGAVSIPSRAHVARAAARTTDRAWPYFRNAGLAVRSGTVGVVVEVPEGWRDRVALAWGGSRPSTSVRFAPCAPGPAAAWNAYSGGFYLRARADCVPLLVRVGGRSTTIRVGVGRACGRS